MQFLARRWRQALLTCLPSASFHLQPMWVQLNCQQEADSTHRMKREMFPTNGADKRWGLTQMHFGKGISRPIQPAASRGSCVDSGCSRAAVRSAAAAAAVYAPVCSGGGAAYPLPRPACTGHCTRPPPSFLLLHTATAHRCTSHGAHCKTTPHRCTIWRKGGAPLQGPPHKAHTQKVLLQCAPWE